MILHLLVFAPVTLLAWTFYDEREPWMLIPILIFGSVAING